MTKLKISVLLDEKGPKSGLIVVRFAIVKPKIELLDGARRVTAILEEDTTGPYSVIKPSVSSSCVASRPWHASAREQSRSAVGAAFAASLAVALPTFSEASRPTAVVMAVSSA
jgi:hypothetical protein